MHEISVAALPFLDCEYGVPFPKALMYIGKGLGRKGKKCAQATRVTLFLQYNRPPTFNMQHVNEKER